MFSFDCGAFEEYLRENQDAVRSETEEIVRGWIADVIGHENLSRVILRFGGTGLEDLKVEVGGPEVLKAKIKAALGGRVDLRDDRRPCSGGHPALPHRRRRGGRRR